MMQEEESLQSSSPVRPLIQLCHSGSTQPNAPASTACAVVLFTMFDSYLNITPLSPPCVLIIQATICFCELLYTSTGFTDSTKHI